MNQIVRHDRVDFGVNCFGPVEQEMRDGAHAMRAVDMVASRSEFKHTTSTTSDRTL